MIVTVTVIATESVNGTGNASETVSVSETEAGREIGRKSGTGLWSETAIAILTVTVAGRETVNETSIVTVTAIGLILQLGEVGTLIDR